MTEFTPEKISLFLDGVIKFGGNVSRAARAVGITRQGVWKKEKNDKDFAAALAEAKELGVKVLEDEAIRRAHDGVAEPIFHRGVQCGTVQKYSDTLMIFLLKGAMPDKYKERSETTLKGDVVSELLKAREGLFDGDGGKS